MRKHAAKAKTKAKAKQPAEAAQAGHRLPCVGFETLADLCGALLQSCMAREDFDPPYALLQLTGAYYQKTRVLLRQPDDTPEMEKVPSQLNPQTKIQFR